MQRATPAIAHCYLAVLLTLSACQGTDPGSISSTTGAPDQESTQTTSQDSNGPSSATTSTDATTSSKEPSTDQIWRDIPLNASITRVQPMTGIVLWEDAWNDREIKESKAISLEYAYVSPATLTKIDGSFDWTPLDELLDRIAKRSHQGVIRFYYTYPGKATQVPDFVKNQSGYQESSGTVEGKNTFFPDWSHAGLQDFHLAFFKAFATRYDQDPRLAFLQVGFGLWGEYHIYEGPKVIGQQFPTHAFQKTFLTALDKSLPTLRWSFSIDAGDSYYSPLSSDPELLNLGFGNFDDSFMIQDHDDYNARMWKTLQHETRYAKAPAGGEISYMSDFDQKNALGPSGIHGRSYASLSRRYHISYMIGNDQPNYHSVQTIQDAGMQNGYRFRITSYQGNGKAAKVSVSNEGIAPIYYDAFLYLDEVAGQPSLQGLLPGETRVVTIDANPESAKLRIHSDRLVPGQKIEFAADLK